MAAAGTQRSDATVALLSLASAAPDAVLLLLALPGDVAWLSALAGGGDGGSSPPRLLLRVYSWPALSARLPAEQAALSPSPRRFLLYPLVLAELAAAARGADDDATLVLFSNVPATARRPPDALLLCDARDVAFQRDPFPEFRAAFSRELAAAAAPALLLVAAELQEPDGSTTLGRDDWNRETVHACYGYLGEELLYDEAIHCAGTSFATPAGLAAYASALAEGFAACNDMAANGGTDQGVHNALTHAQAPARLADLRARAAADPRGPFADAGPARHYGQAVPHAAQLLDAVERLQRDVVIRAARTEDGHVCTLALPARLGLIRRDGQGRVLAIADESRVCALVHQYDRDADLYAHYRRVFAEAPAGSREGILPASPGPGGGA